MNLIILACVVLSVSGICYAAYSMMAPDKNDLRDRLSQLTQQRKPGAAGGAEKSLLVGSLDDVPHQIEVLVGRVFNIRMWLDQAGWTMKPLAFLAIAAGMGGVASLIYAVFVPYRLLTPFVFAMFALLPFLALVFKRNKRLRYFGSQLPAALDLMCQALRAGQSLPAGIQLVAQQTAAPLGPEFSRCYEEQNLGVPLEESLMRMTERVPNLDLRFFATAVLLQRQTGGDLAEILDKIGALIRERFQIWGQIQALTGEGRLSGIVLLALPPSLFLVMLRLNYDYIMMLFNEPLGQKMLIFGIVMQVLGAIFIKKIITIKV